MTYAVVTDPICARHDFPGHPENQRRLDLALSGVPKNVRRLGPAELPRSVIERVHDPGYLAWLERICLSARPVTYIDSDTYLTSSSFDVAAAAAGSACTAVNLTSRETAFSSCDRPAPASGRARWALPDHIAVALHGRSLRRQGRDRRLGVHHGKAPTYSLGTDRVLYCSVHRGMHSPIGQPGRAGSGRRDRVHDQCPLS